MHKDTKLQQVPYKRLIVLTEANVFPINKSVLFNIPHPQHIQAIMQAFNDNNVSFVVRGLQVLVMLADPNGGIFHYCPFSLLLKLHLLHLHVVVL